VRFPAFLVAVLSMLAMQKVVGSNPISRSILDLRQVAAGNVYRALGWVKPAERQPTDGVDKPPRVI